MPENLKWPGEADLKLIKKKFDNRFGDISIFLHKKTQQKIFMKEKRFNDKISLENEYNLTLNRSKLQHPNILQMLGYSVSTEKGLCSTNYYIRQFYAYFERDLRSELAKRITKKKVFSDQELRLISDKIQEALLETHINGLIHGDVRPEMIGVAKDLNRTRVVQAVLLDRLHDDSNPSKLQTKRLVNKQNLFISPELYTYINKKDKSKTMYGRQKNDFFGLGMVLLQIGTNNRQKLQQVYMGKGQFDHRLLNSFVNDFERVHGLDLTLCNSVREYLGMQKKTVVIEKKPVVAEQRKFMESFEETVIQPSNGQPAYKQIKVRKAEFAKSQQESYWRQISSWRTVNTTFQEVVSQPVFHKKQEVEVMSRPVNGHRPVYARHEPKSRLGTNWKKRSICRRRKWSTRSVSERTSGFIMCILTRKCMRRCPKTGSASSFGRDWHIRRRIWTIFHKKASW